MDILCAADGVAQLGLRLACPDVADVLCPVALGIVPMLPGITEERAQDECVEATWTAVAEDGILEGTGSVVLFEVQSEGVLWVLLRQSSVSAMQLESAADREVVAHVTAYELEADGSLPPSASAVANGTTCEDVDATRRLVVDVAEEMVAVGDEGDDGKRQQAVGDKG